MSEHKSSFRSLVELTDKITREELGDYYVVSSGRMNNLLECLETGAERITTLTEENKRLREALNRIASTDVPHQEWEKYKEDKVSLDRLYEEIAHAALTDGEENDRADK